MRIALTGIGHTIVFLGIVTSLVRILFAVRKLYDTTLKTAWIWSLLATAAWAATWFADKCVLVISTAWADHAWYASAVLSLCPPIAVLGSRRPGARVWTWFILVPMLLALSWPIAAVWLHGSEVRNLQLETPQLLAFCLVLVMGLGNYCGTRFTVSALIYGIAVFTIVLSISAATPTWLADRSTTRLWCTIAMLWSITLVFLSRPRNSENRFDRLWFDFFDQFGIVWGRRIQDRVNYIAGQERLPVKLELDGFIWEPQTTVPTDAMRVDSDQHAVSAANDCVTATTRAKAEARVEHILKWLLRRFVDPTWIDRRLGSNSQTIVTQIAVDS